MRNIVRLFVLIALLGKAWTGYAQDEFWAGGYDPYAPPGIGLYAPAANPDIVVSSYWNTGNPNDEFTELLVITDNLDLRNWSIGDNNSSQGAWQPVVTFLNIPLWSNLRSGTVIIIWHRINNSAIPPVANKIDAAKLDGFIMVPAEPPANFFSGGSFPNNTFNLSAAGCSFKLKTLQVLLFMFSGTELLLVQVGGLFLLRTPKLNQKSGLYGTDLCMVCPGSNIDEYGNLPPQDGTTWTASFLDPLPPFDTTFGTPNRCNASMTANSDYWRSLRQPGWTAPVLTGSVNTANTVVTLDWNAANDLNPSDATQGYIILRNTSNTFTPPHDGYSYTVGATLGTATVIENIASSQTITYVDNTPIPCATGFFYQIYAYRYTEDDRRDNGFNTARGRAYNETSFGSVQVTYPAAVEPTSAATDRDNFCADDAGNITLSAPGGSGNVINWYTGSCGGTLVGAGSGANNSITIPSPTVTTTYYARWENACGNSNCVSVTVTVLPNVPASVTITASQNPVCENTSVTFTATPVNGGTPTYQWYLNSGAVGTGAATYTTTPTDGDQVWVEMTSTQQCVTGSPALSNTIIMAVDPNMPVSVTIDAAPNDTVCPNTTVTYTATPINGGPNPTYQWYLNGSPDGGNSPTYSNVPSDADEIHCVVTSNENCATGNPATSNSVIIEIMAAAPVSATLTADPGSSICAGATVTYTANPVNGGSTPSYQWYLNGGTVGSNSATYSNIPADLDKIWCLVTSSLGCATNNPAYSDTITISITSALPVSASILADPGSTVCPGTTVTYTATPENGGTNPSYEWFVNGSAAGSNSSTYSHVPALGDNVYCRVTSDLTCATGNPATSNTITISFSATVPVSITVDADPGTSVCAGTPVTFTASPVNEGTAPVYQWYLNGSTVGSNSPTFTTTPVDADEIYCMLTSDLDCATNNPATSGIITMTIATDLPVSANVIADPGTNICEGSPVIFTAEPENGGSTPIFEWYLNGSVTGGNTDILTFSPADGDQVYCIVTSSFSCATNNPATSNTLTITTSTAQQVTVTIAADPPSVCSGEPVTFTATPGNEGTDPLYEWFIDGNSVQQGTSAVYVSSSLTGTEAVTCTLTSSLTCTVANPVVSAPLTVPVAQKPVVILSNEEYLCTDPNLQLDAGPGFSSYSWQDESHGQYMNAAEKGLYWVTVTNAQGCNGSDSILVENCLSEVYIPNAFSPNGDGTNDFFKAIADPDVISRFSMAIFSRWGEMVFESKDIAIGWDGKANGGLADAGVYVYIINYTTTSSTVTTSEKRVVRGTITLVR